MVAQTALSFILQLGAVLLCTSTGLDIYSDELALVLLSIGLAPICTAGPPLVYMLLGKKDWNFHLRFGRANVFGCLLVILAGLGVCLAANLPAAVVREVLEGLGAKEPDSVLGQGGGWLSFIAELLGVAVMVPMLEEFAFRGVILSGLRRYGTGFAIAASSVIFGMAHMSLSSVVFATIAGVAMGLAYVLTGNLWTSVCIHALNNGIAVIESYSDLILGEGRQELLAGITMLVVCAVGVIALVMLLILRKTLFPKREPLAPADGVLYQPLGFGEAVVTLLKSPVLWAILAMVLVETALMFIVL
jgi:membrane protease YdiL (CAAX protease family)